MADVSNDSSLLGRICQDTSGILVELYSYLTG